MRWQPSAGAFCVLAACVCVAGVADAQPFSFNDRGRPTLQLPFGDVVFRGRLVGTVQSPSRDRGTNRPDPDWQSRRLQIEGTLFKRVEYEVSREFGDAVEPERDMYANVRLDRAIELRAGQFKIPFGYDALTGGANLDFVYRSLAGRYLAPGRDVGIEAHGRLKGRRLTYQAGIFRSDGDNARTSQTRGGSNAIAGRVVVVPFSSSRHQALAAFQAGGAFVTSGLDNALGLRGRTVFDEGVFFDRVFVNGRRLRRGLEASWAHGSGSLYGEFMHVSDQRDAMGLNGEALADITATGWYVAGTYVLTGEHKDGRVDPERGVFNGGKGAFELIGRLESLSFSPATTTGAVASPLGVPPLANADHVATAGLAWYLNRHFKITGSGVFESLRDPERSPVPGSGRIQTVVVQFQAVL